MVTITKEMRSAFNDHRNNAKKRGIDFLFTIEEWCEWWGDYFPLRGNRKGKLVMARKDDSGPYAKDNVFLTRHEENSGPLMRLEVRREAARKGWEAFKAAGKLHQFATMTGALNHRSRAVLAGGKLYDTITQAAKALGVPRSTLASWCHAGRDDFRFA